MERGDRPPETPVPRRRGLRIWRLAAILFALVVVLLLAFPYLLQTDSIRSRVERELSWQTGTPCRIERLAFGWWSGFELRGLTIGSPAGFDPQHPLLAMQRVRADLALRHLLRGRFCVEVEVDGLYLGLDQDESGRSNLEALLPATSPRDARAPRNDEDDVLVRIDPPARDDLDALQLELVLRDAVVEIRQRGELVESLHQLTARIHKGPGRVPIAFTLGGRLLPRTADGSARPGAVHLEGNLDPARGTGSFALRSERLDLGRYRALAAALAPKDALTQLAGVVDGTLRGSFDTERRQVHLDGDLVVQEPALGGSWVGGLDIRSERWTLQSGTVVDFAPHRSGPDLAAARLSLDLGFATLQTLAGPQVAAQLEGKRGIGCEFTVDLDQLADFGGAMPGLLRGAGGRLRGTIALPLDGGRLPAADALLPVLVVEATAEAKQLPVGGLDLRALAAQVTLRHGQLAVVTDPATSLGTGPLALRLRSDLRSPAARTEVACDWRGGAVGGPATGWLRYLVPLLAGLDPDTARLEAVMDLDCALAGPAWPATGESWLQVLDQWAGSGSLRLTKGRLTPAAALAGITAPLASVLGEDAALGSGGQLAIDDLSARFAVQQGFIQSEAMRWLAKGRQLGLSGRVSLRGDLDYRIDLTALLREHRDGARLVAALGDKPLTAGLGGHLDAPRLRLPDAGSLLRSALPGRAEDLLQKAVQDLLRGKRN